MSNDKVELNLENFCSSSSNHIVQCKSPQKLSTKKFSPSPKTDSPICEKYHMNNNNLEISFNSKSTTIPPVLTNSKSRSTNDNAKLVLNFAVNVPVHKMNSLPSNTNIDSYICIASEKESGKNITCDIMQPRTETEEKEEIKKEFMSLTSIEEIKDFYEYTEQCLKRINLHSCPTDESIAKSQILLDEMSIHLINSGVKKLAVFDLDETLTHCETEDYDDCDKILKVKINNKVIEFGINIRPLLQESLRKLQRDYVLVVYTASQQNYAETVLNCIDPNHELFICRLYRHNCIQIKLDSPQQIIYIKDIRIFKNIPLDRIIIIDNSVLSFCYQLDNGIPILPFYDNKNDTELDKLVNYLSYLSKANDIRQENSKVLQLAKLQRESSSSLDDDESSNNSFSSKDDESSNEYEDQISVIKEEMTVMTSENNNSDDYTQTQIDLSNESEKCLSFREKINRSFDEYNKQARRMIGKAEGEGEGEGDE